MKNLHLTSKAMIKRKQVHVRESKAISAFDSDHAQVHTIHCLATKIAAYTVEEEERERICSWGREFLGTGVTHWRCTLMRNKYRFSGQGLLHVHIMGLLGDELEHATARNHALPGA